MRNTVRLGISTPELVASIGLSWVLRRQRITVRRMPRIGDRVELLTAPTGFARRLLTYRDFHLFDPGEERALVSATSEWLLLDVRTRKVRPIPPNIALLEQDLAPASSQLKRPTGPLPPPEEVTAERTFRVSYGMLDFNDHLTNPVFPELMLEPLGRDFILGHQPTLLDVSYQSEARYGEILRAVVGPSGEGFRHALYRQDELLSTLHTEWAAIG